MRSIHSSTVILLLFLCNAGLAQTSIPPVKGAEVNSEQAKVTAQGPEQSKTQEPNSFGVLDKANQSLDMDTDGGVVTNQAMTVAGQDFYHYFVAAWRDKEGSERYTIGVRERPSARFGTEVWVEYRQRRVFRTYLPPARAAIRPISENAAEVAYQVITETDLQNQLIRDADLGRDEF